MCIYIYVCAYMLSLIIEMIKYIQCANTTGPLVATWYFFSLPPAMLSTPSGWLWIYDLCKNLRGIRVWFQWDIIQWKWWIYLHCWRFCSLCWFALSTSLHQGWSLMNPSEIIITIVNCHWKIIIYIDALKWLPSSILQLLAFLSSFWFSWKCQGRI